MRKPTKAKAVKTYRMFAVVRADDPTCYIVGGTTFHYRNQAVQEMVELWGMPWVECKRRGLKVAPVLVTPIAPKRARRKP